MSQPAPVFKGLKSPREKGTTSSMEIDTPATPIQPRENQQAPGILQLMQTMTKLMKQQHELNVKVHSPGGSRLADSRNYLHHHSKDPPICWRLRND